MNPEEYNKMQIQSGALTASMIVELVKFWQEGHKLVIDGKAGPNTQASLNDPGMSLGPLVGTALNIMKRELGRGEVGRNNAGPHVARYRRDQRHAAWCAALVSYCFEEAAKSLGISLPFKRSHGAKSLFKRIGRAGEFVKTPLPGDVVCWDRGKKGSWQGHIGMVVRIDGNTFWSIEGNVGAFPSVVAVYRHELDEARLMGFARLRI